MRSGGHLPALIAVLGLLAVLAVRQVESLDTGFHLRAGESILSGEGWPRADEFIFPDSGHPYVDTSWGHQVLMALFHGAGGTAGLVLFQLLLLLGLFITLYRTGRLLGAEPAVLIPLLLLAVLAAEIRFKIRPELTSFLLLALMLHWLHRRAMGLKVWLWVLPVIQLLWVNAHGLFMLGWVVQACFIVGLRLRQGRFDLPLLRVAAISVPLALLNPNHWRGMVFPLTLLTRFQEGNPFAQAIGELASPLALILSGPPGSYPRFPIWAFLGLAALTILALIPLLRARRYESILLWIVFFPLSFGMVRNVDGLIVALVPPAACALVIPSRFRRGILVITVLAAMVFGLRVFHDAHYIGDRRHDRFGWGWNRLALPVEAAEFVLGTDRDGPVLNHLNFGGYLAWSLNRPVFIDGRLEAIGEEFFQEYSAALSSPRQLEACVTRYGIDWIIFPYAGQPDLLAWLSVDPRWRLEYVDPLAAIFVHQRIEPSSAHLPPDPPPEESLATLPGLGGGERSRGWRHWAAGIWRRERFPTEDQNLGLFHIYRGEASEAAAWFDRAIRHGDGAYTEHYEYRGAALFRLGRYEDALRCFEVVLRDRPDDPTVLASLRETEAAARATKNRRVADRPAGG